MASLLRLRRWTRPHRKVILFMVITASGAMLAQSLVPLIIGRVVDGPIKHHHTSGLYGLAGLALLLGLLEAVLFYLRRIAMSQAALGVESDARAELSGTAVLNGPARDPHDAAADELVELYRGIAGEHPDWDEYRAAMVKDSRVALSFVVEHTYGQA